ncbi:hypothetical protein KV708_15765 [Comamonas thiooxydans]|uniref:hypothetical protein n=1 Tax=Comamonas thiooxydans TaxID=363952 RepID=UPI00070F5364|nr:hypothetical protein [Comamonas thiooxydans]
MTTASVKPYGWFMPATLIALGRYTAHAVQPFTVAELQKIVPELAEGKDARRACKLLEQRRLAAPCPTQRLAWELTPAGVQTCKAALYASLAEGKCKPAMIRPNKLTVADQISARLWNLLRIRNVLTSVDAVSVLANAGDNTVYLQAVIGRLLRAWSEACPDAVEVSKKRVNGALRYVLKRDIGPQAPVLAKARKEIA